MQTETIEFTTDRSQAAKCLSGNSHYFQRLEEGHWHLVSHPRYPKGEDERAQAVALAMVLVENNKHVLYDVWKWNCEHFVSYILLGEGETESLQVLNVTRKGFIAKAKLYLDYRKATKGKSVMAKEKCMF